MAASIKDFSISRMVLSFQVKESGDNKMKRRIIWAAIAIVCEISALVGAHTGQENAEYYSNEWVVRLAGGREVAELIAEQMGYKLLGEVSFPTAA